MRASIHHRLAELPSLLQQLVSIAQAHQWCTRWGHGVALADRARTIPGPFGWRSRTVTSDRRGMIHGPASSSSSRCAEITMGAVCAGSSAHTARERSMPDHFTVNIQLSGTGEGARASSRSPGPGVWTGPRASGLHHACRTAERSDIGSRVTRFTGHTSLGAVIMHVRGGHMLNTSARLEGSRRPCQVTYHYQDLGGHSSWRPAR